MQCACCYFPCIIFIMPLIIIACMEACFVTPFGGSNIKEAGEETE
jgi:hypothetical protein